MYYLTAEDILYLHFRVIEDYGGSHGIRDENRLKSVVNAPKQEAFGVEQYSDVFQKAAVYARNIIADHLFVDGNKRSGITAASIFLIKNGHRICASQKELEDFAVQIAVEHLDIPVIAAWFKAQSKKN
ncbi:type II toxin-antitoxin system death-on-curing family toxin [Candidatus Saccharibacteria bacterium]|nr:type II toxin-antitoxin system death-on-curing family toxin [Candidatus Saccharibacteria bacterium]